MSNSATQKPVTCTARCEDCGSEIPDVAWSPGTPCPRCGSGHFVPVPVIRKGTDYDAADRSKGFAIEDIRFGRLALWAGMIDAKSLQQVLHRQRAQATASGTAPDLGSMLVRRKVMNRNQVRAVVNALGAVPGNAEDADFARSAVASGFVTADKVEVCRKLQERTAQVGREAPPLPLLLYERRYLQENQVVALLKAAEKKEKGVVYRIRRDVERMSQSRLRRMFASRSGPALSPRIVGILVVLCVVLAVVLYRSANKPATASVQCVECGALSGAPENSKWPIKCPECGQKAVYPLAICLECGERFPIKNIGYGVACPKCRSTKFRMITNKLDLAAIEAKIKGEGK